MAQPLRLSHLSLALCSALVLSACTANPFKKGEDSTATPATTAPAQPAGIPPGMNAQGEVVDSTKIEAGHGQQVKGINDWEGEITGKPFAGSKFTQLKIGMPMRQVMDLIGQPSDQGSYVTAKAWIPFYFGADRYRHELVYKGQGRLVFSGGSVGDWSSGHLTWIIYNRNEAAYR